MELRPTITAISTPAGEGGIAVIRISGENAFAIVDKVWKGKALSDAKSHTLHLGNIVRSDGSILDQAVASVFRSPNSYTGEDVVELSVHGSRWIQKELIQLLIDCGAKGAEPGEFTKRAFLNGKLDLTQAESVADVIAASSAAAHRLAITQLNGTFSSRLTELRDSLINLCSLLELELDFSEEDVEFADRSELNAIGAEILEIIARLRDSFQAGKAIKEGVNVVIAGPPNAGKSTLLNTLLGEEKAIVTDVPGTTRDSIEGTIEIDGILFRFTDTAGIHDTQDTVEKIGINRALESLKAAAIVLWLSDSEKSLIESIQEEKHKNASPLTETFKILTKADLQDSSIATEQDILRISSKSGFGIDALKQKLVETVRKWGNPDNELIVSNARQAAELASGAESLERGLRAINEGMPADMAVQDIREAVDHLSALTGAITTPDLLQTIFSKFCIGK
ncbi:MAG: tRNA uridine-5-carboxymethylaminomethyl(34) synthesis GTPase MnmE [Muribaculaceae bacterium]|nr:tRNA uridine-5-carboxymethylaminomethyl(34) synthesis GTPase MnmE [Muribaculaceae bacterium]